MKKEYISDLIAKEKLPDSPGVYLFKSGKKILYIGKATSLKDRVKSYFSNDLIKTRGRLIVDMTVVATSLEHIKTDSVLEALMLETELIKRHQPHYNTKEKDNKSFNYVVITDEDFPRVLVVRGRNLEQKTVDYNYKYLFGPYPFGGELREAMRLIRKIFPYRDTCMPCEDQKLSKSKTKKSSKKSEKKINNDNHVGEGLELIYECKPCFNRSIGLCPGVCSGEISKKDYGRQINHLRLFFQGRKADLMKVLNKDMKAYAKEMKFELANDIKQTINALNHIQDVSMIKRETSDASRLTLVPEDLGDVTLDTSDSQAPYIYRMEAYDIAHLSGTDMVGVMTVMNNGQYNKAEYRTFIIRTVEGSNDVAALREIIARRLTHSEWQLPHMMIVDGGKAQLALMRQVVEEQKEIFEACERPLPVIVAVVKDDRHKARELLTDDASDAIVNERSRQIIELNAESHRFAIATHRKKRTSSRGLKRKKRKLI